MAATAPVMQRPDRGLSWVRQQSTGPALAIVALGAIALLTAIAGSTAVLAAYDFTPLESLVAGLTSTELRVVLIGAAVLGTASIALGWGAYSRMPTKISREESFAGAILGLQAAVLALVLLWVVSGDVAKFALNYFKFDVLGPLLGAFFNGAKNTILLAFTSEALGIALGLFLAMFAISKRAVVRAPARIYINFFRGTPLIWQVIFIGTALPLGLGLDIGPFQAMIAALSLNAAAYIAEVFRAGIQSVERGQLEAARGLGMSYMQGMRYAVLPQAVRRVIPPLMNEFVILIKDTALVILLGLTTAQREIMTVADQAVANSFNATPYIMAAVAYLVVTLPLIRAVNALERRMRSGLVGIGA